VAGTWRVKYAAIKKMEERRQPPGLDHPF